MRSEVLLLTGTRIKQHPAIEIAAIQAKPAGAG
jgi:hypothetical protein